MTTKPVTQYRKLSDELTILVDELQSGQVDIDDALVKYERGVEIINQLQKFLDQAENRVTKIKANFEK